MIENAYNYHTHTVRCGHATGEDREYVEEAIRGGIKKMGFSDHISLRYPDGYEAGYRVPTDRAKEYAESVRALQKEYAGKIEIFLGFETEYYVDQFEKMLAFSKELGVDYWILGQHFVGGDRDNVYSGWEGDDENRLAQYAAQVCAAMETGKFSYVAHPDLLNYTGEKEIYCKHMRKIAEKSKETGIPLEINFLGIRDNRHYPNERFWEIAGEVGSPVVFGFDAHDPRSAADKASLKKANELIEKYRLNVIDEPKLLPL